MFKKLCDRNGLDAKSFHGPERNEKAAESDSNRKAYSFLWTGNRDEVIAITVTYLPYDQPYSISGSISLRKVCREKKADLADLSKNRA
jgi:hypothetical protein